MISSSPKPSSSAFRTTRSTVRKYAISIRSKRGACGLPPQGQSERVCQRLCPSGGWKGLTGYADPQQVESLCGAAFHEGNDIDADMGHAEEVVDGVAQDEDRVAVLDS